MPPQRQEVRHGRHSDSDARPGFGSALGSQEPVPGYFYRLDLYVEAERGSLYSCSKCGKACQAHDFADKTWRHLNFFQHHCYLHARVLRTKCPEHGVKRIEAPWARPGSDFTLLFEQAAISLVKEMPVLAVSRQLEISDKRLWHLVHHYVGRMLGELDLSNVVTVGVDETASRRGHRYVTVLLDMQRKQEPVVFAVPGCGKDAIKAFSTFLAAHGGEPDNVVEVVCLPQRRHRVPSKGRGNRRLVPCCADLH